MTATLEIIDTQKTKPKRPKTYHFLPTEELIKKFRGLPFKALCGKTFKPHPRLDGMKHKDLLDPVEQCIVCQHLKNV